jgi:hypothetical protein
MNCIICGRPADRHHIKTRGSGGGDEESNILLLDRIHHVEIHKMGLNSFIKKYPNVRQVLIAKGWEYNEFLGRWVYAKREAPTE